MEKQYLTKIYNRLTEKNIPCEHIQEDYLTCVKIPLKVENAQPFVIEEYYDCDLECPVIVTKTQTKISLFEVFTEEDFNEYMRMLEFFVG